MWDIGARDLGYEAACFALDNGEERRGDLAGFLVGVCFLEVVGVVVGSIFVGGRGKGVLFVCLFVCLGQCGFLIVSLLLDSVG